MQDFAREMSPFSRWPQFSMAALPCRDTSRNVIHMTNNNALEFMLFLL